MKGLQHLLDIMKAAKEMSGGVWLPRDTNNWLKKDDTYKVIVKKVVVYLNQNSL